MQNMLKLTSRIDPSHGRLNPMEQTMNFRKRMPACIGGKRIDRDRVMEVFNPYTGECIGCVPKAGIDDVRNASTLPQSIDHGYPGSSAQTFSTKPQQ